jgi:hypothetical protein
MNGKLKLQIEALQQEVENLRYAKPSMYVNREDRSQPGFSIGLAEVVEDILNHLGMRIKEPTTYNYVRPSVIEPKPPTSAKGVEPK